MKLKIVDFTPSTAYWEASSYPHPGIYRVPEGQVGYATNTNGDKVPLFVVVHPEFPGVWIMSQAAVDFIESQSEEADPLGNSGCGLTTFPPIGAFNGVSEQTLLKILALTATNQKAAEILRG